MNTQQRLQTIKTEVSKKTVLKQLLPQQSFNVKLTVCHFHLLHPLKWCKYSFTHRTHTDARLGGTSTCVLCLCVRCARPHWSSNSHIHKYMKYLLD